MEMNMQVALAIVGLVGVPAGVLVWFFFVASDETMQEDQI